MMRGKFFLMYSIVLVFLISGCGSPGGGAVYFDTVEISAHCDIPSLDSDVALWKDSNNDSDDLCDYWVARADTAQVTIRSKSFENIAYDSPSDVRIEKVQIDYTAADDSSPDLASRSLALGQFVEPDCFLPLDIMVVDQEQKLVLPLSDLIRHDLFSQGIYTYFVKLTFYGVEVTTDKEKNFTTDLTIQVSDFITDEEKCSWE